MINKYDIFCIETLDMSTGLKKNFRRVVFSCDHRQKCRLNGGFKASEAPPEGALKQNFSPLAKRDSKET